MQIAVSEAKAHLAELIRLAEAGEVIELTRYGRPVARVVAVERAPVGPLIGALKGQITVPADIFEGDAEIREMFRSRNV
ncbi:MAG: type II toxin-antitoxin system prevent-host-death family antitoxin [bacterium]|nr:type II toxin-antitoxin system prevent-host-death family antitoxin [bacterium]